jgi:hypothetical protein
MGDLGSRQDKGGGALRASFYKHVRSVEAGESSSQSSASETVSERCVTAMTGPASEAEIEDINEVLLNAEVVEGPPGFREMVAELWPELLHKVKPPISEMH